MVKLYSSAISGESYYQAAIKRTSVGERVKFRREPDNPHDPLAIAVENVDGDTIGYLPPNGFLREAILVRFEEPECRIQDIGRAPQSLNLGVVLSVNFKSHVPSIIYEGRFSDPKPRGLFASLIERLKR